MDPKRSSVVQEFRRRLESATFFIGSVNDSEVESWLFCAGPKRIELLQWCLGCLDPTLQNRFQGCDEEEAEKRTIAHVKALGLSHNTNAILGTAPDEDQHALWKRMLVLFNAGKHFHDSKDNTKKLSTIEVVSSLNRSKDFQDLLNTGVELLPTELRLAPTSISKKNVTEELEAIVSQLEEYMSDTFIHADNDEDSGVDQYWCFTDEYKETFYENFKRIQECYNHLVHSVFPSVQRQPENPVTEVLGSYVENLADHVISFVEMLTAKENIYKVARELQSSAINHNLKSVEVPEMLQTISSCHSLVVEILSLWRVHKML